MHNHQEHYLLNFALYHINSEHREKVYFQNQFKKQDLRAIKCSVPF